VNLAELQEELAAFRGERGWARYHDPKSLAAALSVEAGELLEHFIWAGPEEAAKHAAEHAEEVASELADVIIFAANLANAAGIHLTQALVAKLELNESRFPVGEPGNSPPSRDK